MDKMQNRSKAVRAAFAQETQGGSVSPSLFMRARRPHLFSDSRIVTQSRLSREVLDHFFDTITNRKDEIAFEEFCRRLAEKEIAPNLIPQTGPTGGGDSKVDSETYPVSEEIALTWYEGIDRRSGQEPWAFAFSAKKRWRQKAQADVENILSKQRKYALIYFITGQYVRDKQRAEVEDQLKRQNGVEVRILDRNWILKSVYEHDHLQLVIDSFNLSADTAAIKQTGPNDTEREVELKELDVRISDPANYGGALSPHVEDCLRTAILARGLERPRTEVENRFLRAENIARQSKNSQLLLRVVYNKAWTAYWWYEDYTELARLYDEVEGLAINSDQASNLELLVNLWTVLHTSLAVGKLDPQIAKLEPRTRTLRHALESLASDTTRPNNALSARSHLLQMELMGTVARREDPAPILGKFADIFKQSERLAEFPVNTLAQIIRELGDVLPDSPQFDRLYDVVVEAMKTRDSRAKAGELTLERGLTKLRAGKHYDAIKWLGQAQQLLAMEEYTEELIQALAGCAFAYEQVGLLWAARANLIRAANYAISPLWREGRFVRQALRYLQRMVWIELGLGRIPQALQLLELSRIIAAQLALESGPKREYEKQREAQDQVLAMLFLKVPFWELKWLDFLPNILDRMNLNYSWLALLYALGYEEFLRSEGAIPESESAEGVRDSFLQWREQPANDDLPEVPQLMRNRRETLRSYVLGCEVTIQADNTPVSLGLAETILGALEAFLATSIDGSLFPYRSQMHIYLEPSYLVDQTPVYEIDQASGGEIIRVRHPVRESGSTEEEQNNLQSWLFDFIVAVTTQLAFAPDAKAFSNQVLKIERGVGRALGTSEASWSAKNILGRAPKLSLQDWETETGPDRFPLQRVMPWDHNASQAPKTEEISVSELKRGEGAPPSDLFGIDGLRHKERRVYSLINVPLWDRAKWRAIMYTWPRDIPDAPPCLALVFENSEAAKNIFREWRTKLGGIDKEELLRVAIVTGIDKHHPSHYMVHLSVNPKLDKRDKGEQFILTSRVHKMQPEDLRNLNGFLEQYKRARAYILAPVLLTANLQSEEPFFDLAIVKKTLLVKAAWEIGENDLDRVVIQRGDAPIIPKGVKNPPVRTTLQKRSKRRRSL